MHFPNFSGAAVVLFVVLPIAGAICTAQPTTDPSTQPGASTAPSVLNKVTVTSFLDQARDQIFPSIGTNQYTLGPAQIELIPQGENANFQQVVLRSPGVVEDSYGQEHVRGEHANVTYSINGVLLPQPINTFGQEIDTHLIQSVTLIDGALPAEYGFHTAGIFDVTTKSGANLRTNEVSLYGGSYGTINPSIAAGGTNGNWDIFVTASYKQDNLGIESPTAGRTPLHDFTDQTKAFAYISYHIDDTSRVSLLLNGSTAEFQIPNTPGLAPSFNLTGNPPADSATLNENQHEQNYYSVLSYQKSTEDFSMQVSGFYNYGQIHFIPDNTGDLIFQGVSGDIRQTFNTEGLQADASYNLTDHHTLRFGLIGDYTDETSLTSTAVFPVDPNTGAQSSNVPMTIVDNTANHTTEFGVYAQDEWKLLPTVTVNYGLRWDIFNANFDNENQLSPRVNLVWKPTPKTTAHIGYARYFVTPSAQYTDVATIAKFTNTTNAAASLVATAPKAEKSDYFDAGVSQQFTKNWSVNVDAYAKQAHDLIDNGQFGSAVILSDFNYDHGYSYGTELSTTFKHGDFSFFGNFALNLAAGQNITTQQFLIDPAELAYIQSHYIPLDHEAEYTVSAGMSYNITHDDLAYVDFLFSSGLRNGFANSGKQPDFYPISVGYQHVFHPGGPGAPTLTARFDIVNLFDDVYDIRDGSGIGVAAPQWGQRRSYYVGMAYDF